MGRHPGGDINDKEPLKLQLVLARRDSNLCPCRDCHPRDFCRIIDTTKRGVNLVPDFCRLLGFYWLPWFATLNFLPRAVFCMKTLFGTVWDFLCHPSPEQKPQDGYLLIFLSPLKTSTPFILHNLLLQTCCNLFIELLIQF